MSRTVTRLFDTHAEAIDAITDLEAAGVPHEDISLIASNADGAHDGHRHKTGDAVADNDAAEGAGKGAATGGLIGAGGGLLAGLGMLAIPGIGPVVAAGWLVSTVVGAAAGAAAGAATGGILGALKDAGHSDEDAQVYAEGVRRGGTLVSVKASDETRAGEIDRLLAGRAGVDAAVRGADYRQSGWSGYDADAKPYSIDEVAQERSRYGTSAEPRSFDQPRDSMGNPQVGDDDVRPLDPQDRPTPGIGGSGI